MKKKIYILVIAICSLFVHNIHAEHTFYVYQNTGVIDAFFTYEVDSIVYSNLDLDSVWHETSQVQEIWTIDSVYRIPLEIIDSVSFITPETEYKEGVINMSDNLMDYLIRCDSMTLFFRGNTSVDILPEIGDKIVTTEMNDILPSGFVGEVLSVTLDNNEYVVVCTEVALTDVFETYYSVSSVYGFNNQERVHHRLPAHIDRGSLDFTLGPYVWDLEKEGNVVIVDNSDLAINYEKNMSLIISPTFHIKTFLIIGGGEGVYFDYDIIGDFKIEEKVSFTGDISYSKELSLVTFKAPVAAFVDFYIEPGLSIESQLTASLDISAMQNFKMKIGDDFSSVGKDVLKPVSSLRLESSNFEVVGCVDGEMAIGAYLKCGFQIKDKSIAQISVTGTLGHQIKGGAVLYKSELESAYEDTKLYKRLKNERIEYNIFGKTNLSASAFADKFEVDYDLPFTFSKNIETWNIVPEFNEVSFVETDFSSVAKSKINGNCLFPVGYGYSVRDVFNEEIDKYSADGMFRKGSVNHEYSFPRYSKEREYTLYPTVELFGFKMLATPSVNPYCEDEEHYHAVDLGLSSNILWACYNLGATSPEDYGEYYAYAEKTTKNKYSERNYLFFYYDYQFDGQYSYYESIPGVGADISGSVYDVVAEQWGEGWRMPTHKEMQELVDSCIWTWTTKEGVIGYKVTGPNGNSIFLPASGAKYTTTGSDVLVGKTYDYAGDPNKLTWYRSSVMSSKQLGNDGFGYTYGIKFKQDVYDCSDACMKYAGYVIRPVKDKEVVSGDK